MRSMILSAGRGERLNPITLFMPKPMVPLCGKPVMEYVVDLLAQHEFKSVIANLHYLPDQIESYFGNGQRWGINLTYSLEKNLLGTAGAVKRVADYFDETFCVIPGDQVTNLNLTTMLEFHRQNKASVTVALHHVDGEAPELLFKIDELGKLLEISKTTAPQDGKTGFASMGIYFLEPEVLKFIPADTNFDLNVDLLPLLLEKQIPVYGYGSDCFWAELGNFSGLQKAQNAILERTDQGFFLPGVEVSSKQWLGRNTSISPSATIIPPVLIGDNCQIQDHAVIGPNTVIGDNVIVSENATVTNSTVLAGTYVGKLVNVKDSIVKQNCLINIPSNTSLFLVDNFLLGEVGEDMVFRESGRALEWIATFLLIIVSIPLMVIAGFLALFSGTGNFIEDERRVSYNPRVLTEEGKIGWREIIVHRFRAAQTTPTGRWLARTGMRYLPALFAVLKGDLSLVGTGPLDPEQVSLLKEEWHHQRFHAKAGLTGLWYTNRHNYPEKKMTLEDQLLEDSFYAVTRTWRDDLKIFLKSISLWLRALV